MRQRCKCFVSNCGYRRLPLREEQLSREEARPENTRPLAFQFIVKPYEAVITTSVELAVQRESPWAMTAIGVFLFFGAVMASLAGSTLIWPGTLLDHMWVLNAPAYRELAPFGKSVGVPFLVLSAALAAAGVGWFGRRLWGWRLAVVIIATQVLGDLVSMFLGHFVRGAAGVTIASALLLYLLRPRGEGRFCTASSDREMTANSSVEFLIWLLIAASVIAVIAKRIGIPYTVALVLGGLLLSVVHLPALAPLHQGNRPDWLTPDVILTLFLPALLFEGSLKIDLRHITTDIVPLLLLANLGVLIATLVTGFVINYAVGMSLIVALLFGSMVSATDPISVLSIFREVAVDERLSVLVEGESLLNDGTAVALFQILLASAVGGGVGLVWGAGQFLLSVVGGALMGLALGYFVSKLTKRIDDAQIEITFTTILAYGTFLLARHLHLSGVIATVAAGLVIGNFAAKTGMSARTLTALRSFWEYASFIINSLVFLLIGLEVRLGGVLRAWKPILIAVAAIFLGRILTVYTLVPLSNLFSKPISFVWQHVLVWGWIARSFVAGPGVESR